MKLSTLLKPRSLLTAAICLGGIITSAMALNVKSGNYGIWDPDDVTGNALIKPDGTKDPYEMAYKSFPMPNTSYTLYTNAWGVANAAVGDKDERCGYQIVSRVNADARQWSVDWGFANNALNKLRIGRPGDATWNKTYKGYYSPIGDKDAWVNTSFISARIWKRRTDKNKNLLPYVYRPISYIKSYPHIQKKIGKSLSNLTSVNVGFDYWLNDRALNSKGQYKVMHELVFNDPDTKKEVARFQIEIFNKATGNTKGRTINIDGGKWRFGSFGTFPAKRTPVYTLSLAYGTNPLPSGVKYGKADTNLNIRKYITEYNEEYRKRNGKYCISGNWILSVINTGIEIVAGQYDSHFGCTRYNVSWTTNTASTQSLSTLSEDTTTDTTPAGVPQEFVASEYLAMYPDVATHYYYGYYPEAHWIDYGSNEGRYPCFAARELAEGEDDSAPRTNPDALPASYEETSTDTNFLPNSSLDYKLVSASTGGVLAITENFASNNQPLEQQDDNGMLWQRWCLEPLGGGFIRIVNRETGKVLDANPDGSWTVKQWDYVSTATWHQWRLIPCGNNLYKIQNRHTGKYITVGNLSEEVDAGIGQWTDVGYNAGQMFRLVAELGSSDNVEQKFFIQSKATVDAGRWYVLDLLYADPNNYAKIGQCNWWGGENQKWIFDSLPDSQAMSIRNAATSTVVDGDMSGYGVKMWSYYADVDWHDWIPEHLGGGYYRIVNVYTGKFLTMGSWSINPWSPGDQSATLIQYPWYGNPGQIWKLGKVD